MPRQKLHRKSEIGPKVRWTIKVPAELSAIIENHFWSTTYGKPIYGKRNQLVVELLWNYVSAHDLMSSPPIPSISADANAS